MGTIKKNISLFTIEVWFFFTTVYSVRYSGSDWRIFEWYGFFAVLFFSYCYYCCCYIIAAWVLWIDFSFSCSFALHWQAVIVSWEQYIFCRYIMNCFLVLYAMESGRVWYGKVFFLLFSDWYNLYIYLVWFERLFWGLNK